MEFHFSTSSKKTQEKIQKIILQNPDMFLQTLTVHLRRNGASEFQGISAKDFNFVENQTRSVMCMVVVAKIIF